MSFLSDLFGGADNAAQAQISGINQGLSQAIPAINAGTQALNTNYTAGLQPFLQNYAGAQPGVNQLGNVLGLNGAAGDQSAMATLASTPGFQFQKQQGDNSINAAAAANGTLNSGNQALALSKYNQGLAGTTYGNYVSQLQPYLGASANAAGGIGGLYSGLGNQTNANQMGLAKLQMDAQTGIGNANASADLADQSLGQNLLGSALSLGVGLFSDARLKEDIAPVGELYDGSNVYSYRYKGDPTPRIGLMAQEVEQRYPDAVKEVGGYKAVNYGMATEFASELGKFLKAA